MPRDIYEKEFDDGHYSKHRTYKSKSTVTSFEKPQFLLNESIYVFIDHYPRRLLLGAVHVRGWSAVKEFVYLIVAFFIFLH